MGELTRSKNYKVSRWVILLWFIGIVFLSMLKLLAGPEDITAILTIGLLTGMTVSALYGSVMMDIGTVHEKTYTAIKIIVGFITSAVLMAVMLKSHFIIVQMANNITLSVIAVMCISMFIVISGADMMVRCAWILSTD